MGVLRKDGKEASKDSKDVKDGKDGIKDGKNHFEVSSASNTGYFKQEGNINSLFSELLPESDFSDTQDIILNLVK